MSSGAKQPWERLGVRSGDRVWLIDVPSDLARRSLAGPASATLEGLPSTALERRDVVVAFVDGVSGLERLAAALAPGLGDDPRLWVAYKRRPGQELSLEEAWAPLDALGLVRVDSIRLEPGWTALRYRRPAA